MEVETKKILFADDDPEIREVLRLLLTSEGYAVAEASSGREVLEQLDGSVDLVILDVMMPDLGGYAVCAEIRKRSAVPVLFLTAKGQDSDKTLGFSVGGDDYLVKPFSYTELISRVHENREVQKRRRHRPGRDALRHLSDRLRKRREKPSAGKEAPKQSQQVTPKKSDKKSSKDDKGSPSVKGTSGKEDDDAKPPAADPGKNDAPAAKPSTPDPVQKDLADTTVKGQEGAKTPAVEDGTKKDSQSTEKKDKGAASKGTKDSAAKKADQKKPAVKSPAADKNAPIAGKSPTVKSGK